VAQTSINLTMKQRRFSVSMNPETYRRMCRMAALRGSSQSGLLKAIVDRCWSELDPAELGDESPPATDEHPGVQPELQAELEDESPPATDEHPGVQPEPEPEPETEPEPEPELQAEPEPEPHPQPVEPPRPQRPPTVPVYQLRGERIVKPTLEPKSTDDPHGGGTQLW
jgi:hypothetical protein